MKILNLYYSATGNTAKVAEQIEKAIRTEGHEVTTVKATKDIDLDILAYDYVFIGCGVFMWLPGKPLMKLINNLQKKYREEIKSAAPRRPGKKAIVYCTFGGGHTGANEAVAVVKYSGQLFDHLGYEIIAEWYFPGEYHGKHENLNIEGRLGKISGRPNEGDLQEIYEKVIAILRV